MEENKYFIPEIFDLRIGYEYEFQGIPKGWHKLIFSEENSLKTMRYNIEKLEDTIRVPYLTKEQIEAEGWKFTGRSIDVWFEKEGKFDLGSWTSYKIRMHYGKDHHLYIHAVDCNDENPLFEGECKSINEFRTICKWLKI